MATSTRIDIDRQRDIDDARYSPQASLAARMKAVLQAQRRLCLREPDAGYELRQSLSPRPPRSSRPSFPAPAVDLRRQRG
jgi:hypothetical protein